MTKVSRKAKAGGGGSKAKASSSKAPQVTAAQLFQQAQIALRFDDFDSAKEALRRAVKLEPNNPAWIDAYACLLAELGDDDAEEALKQVVHRSAAENSHECSFEAGRSGLAAFQDVLIRAELCGSLSSQAVRVAPTSGHEKYMYLAQLADDPAAAIQYSTQGLALLQAQLDTAQQGGAAHSADARALSKALSKALCAHAELLLSQACSAREAAVAQSQPSAAAERSGGAASTSACPPDPRTHPLDPAVVSQVEEALKRAKTLEPNSPEPGQGRSEAALAALKESMSHWWDPEDSDEECEDEGEGRDNNKDTGGSAMQEDMQTDGQGVAAMDAEDAPGPSSTHPHTHQQGPAGADESDGEDEEDDIPSFEFRFECAKLLLELDESTETAVGVLSALIEEYDSNPDVWHLLALALYSGHEYQEALEVAVKGQELLRRMRVPKKDPAWGMFEELTSAIKEAAGNAAAAAGAAGIKPGF